MRPLKWAYHPIRLVSLGHMEKYQTYVHAEGQAGEAEQEGGRVQAKERDQPSLWSSEDINPDLIMPPPSRTGRK